MPLEVTNVKRVFSVKINNKKIDLPDPNPEFTVEEVLQFHSTQYSELTTCTIDGPILEEDRAKYEFKTTVGTKS